MKDDAAEYGEPPEDDGLDADADSNADDRDEPRLHVSPDVLRNLSTFSALQRHVAGLDLSAIRSIQRTFEQSAAFAELPKFAAAHNAVVENVRRSIDMSSIQAVLDQMASAVDAVAIARVQQQWADVVANAIDLPSLKAANEGLIRSADFGGLGEAQQRLLDAIKVEIDFSALTRTIDLGFDNGSFRALLDRLDSWIPGNLRRYRKLEDVARITLDEGLPLSWVPRTEIVEALVDAADDHEREQILTDRFDDILDDCSAVLVDIACEWADQCRSAIGALAAGFDAPAQSHAGNIIDSVVLRLLGRTGRDIAKKNTQHEFAALPLQLVSESLTLRPLYRAFTQWFPDGGDRPPEHFARHATAHAVGHRGLFGKHQALIAVMLATSLTRQFWDDPDAPQDDLPGPPS